MWLLTNGQKPTFYLSFRYESLDVMEFLQLNQKKIELQLVV